MTDRDATLRLVISGITQTLEQPPPHGGDLHTTRNAAETIFRRVDRGLRQAVEDWDRTGREPDWHAVVDRMRTDGWEFVGPTGHWVEYVDSDAPVLAYASHWMADRVRRQIEAALRALDHEGPRP